MKYIQKCVSLLYNFWILYLFTRPLLLFFSYCFFFVQQSAQTRLFISSIRVYLYPIVHVIPYSHTQHSLVILSYIIIEMSNKSCSNACCANNSCAIATKLSTSAMLSKESMVPSSQVIEYVHSYRQGNKNEKMSQQQMNKRSILLHQP